MKVITVNDTGLGLIPKEFEWVRQQGLRITLRQRENYPLTSSVRGKKLLDFEKKMRGFGSPYEVFLEPQGDINKLRLKLRGVKVE